MVQEEIDNDKYKALFEYQKNAYESYKAQYIRMEDKASKYVTILTILISAFTLLIKYYFLDYIFFDKTAIYWVTVSCIALTILGAISAGRFLFNCLGINEVLEMPVGDGVVDYFCDHSRATVYLGLARVYVEAIDLYKKHGETRAEYLKKAKQEINFTTILLFISLILIIVSVNFDRNHFERTSNNRLIKDNEVFLVSKNSNIQNQSTEIRPPIVPAPPLERGQAGITLPSKPPKDKHIR